MKRTLALLLLLLLLPACWAVAEEEQDWSIEETVELLDDGEEVEVPAETAAPDDAETEHTARDEMIDRIISLGHELYVKANGKAQRAQYSGDIYVCKNFTTYLFRQVRGDFCMAEYPDTKLVIPNNLPSAQCKPYYYGLAWEEVSAEDGNPFYAAAEFRYDTSLSEEENMELALEFMRQVKRGDYFQMSANYRYGVGAHSAIMIADYDPETDSVHWMDSNMRGKKVNGERYGYVQYDEVQTVQWWAEAFCQKKRGATIYRLRDDIIYVTDAGN